MSVLRTICTNTSQLVSESKKTTCPVKRCLYNAKHRDEGSINKALAQSGFSLFSLVLEDERKIMPV